MKNNNINPENLFSHSKRAGKLLKAMGNERRFLILCHLLDGEVCVGELEKKVDLRQSALSQHLAKLRDAGLVETRREAQSIYYSIKGEEVEQVMEAVNKIYG